METIDLTSIAGIMACTWAIVAVLKRALAKVNYLNCVPLWAYGLLVSSGLTWLAHDVLHTLQGDSLGDLLGKAALASLAASGMLEQLRTAGKPLSDSTTSRRVRVTGKVFVGMLALSLSLSACASTGGALVIADNSVHDAIGIARRVGKSVCDPLPANEPCEKFYTELVAAVREADSFNRAVALNSTAAVPAMLASVSRLAVTLDRVMPSAETRAEVKTKIDLALAHLRALGGK